MEARNTAAGFGVVQQGHGFALLSGVRLGGGEERRVGPCRSGRSCID
jgi:hypothetical protein